MIRSVSSEIDSNIGPKGSSASWVLSQGVLDICHRRSSRKYEVAARREGSSRILDSRARYNGDRPWTDRARSIHGVEVWSGGMLATEPPAKFQGRAGRLACRPRGFRRVHVRRRAALASVVRYSQGADGRWLRRAGGRRFSGWLTDRVRSRLDLGSRRRNHRPGLPALAWSSVAVAGQAALALYLGLDGPCGARRRCRRLASVAPSQSTNAGRSFSGEDNRRGWRRRPRPYFKQAAERCRTSFQLVQPMPMSGTTRSGSW